VEDDDEVGNPRRVHRAEAGTARLDLVKTPGSRGCAFGRRPKARGRKSGGSTSTRGRRQTTLKGTEAQESIERVVGLTAAGAATDSLRGATP